MMKRLVVALAVALMLAAVPSRGAQFVPPDNSLKLSAEVVGRELCAGRGGVWFLHLRVRLRYMNAGRERVILYKGSNLFFQVVVNGIGSKYELRTTSASFRTREAEKVDAPSPTADFIVLRPQGVYEREVSVSLPVARNGAPRGAGEIERGEHSMRLVVSTWYESRALGETLRERWRRRGKLWTDAVVSVPFKFDARADGEPRACK